MYFVLLQLSFFTQALFWGARPYPGCPELSFSTTPGVLRVARTGWAATVPSTKHKMLMFFCQYTLSWDGSHLKCYLTYTRWKTVFIRQQSQPLKKAVFSVLLAACIRKLYLTHDCEDEEWIPKITNSVKE